MKTTTTLYVLDNQDRIVLIEGAWDEFAKDNDGANLSSDEVYGQLIWDYVTGDTTRMWLEALFQYARVSALILERLYRCDSPNMKRFMRMRIIPLQTNCLRIEHEVLATEQRAVPVKIQYSKNMMKNTKRRCSICGRLNIDGAWQEPHLNHKNESKEVMVIYSVCDDCQRLLPGSS